MPKLPRRLRLYLHLGRLLLDRVLRLGGAGRRHLRRNGIDARRLSERSDGGELASTLPRLVFTLLVDDRNSEAVDARDDEISETACSPGVDVADEKEDANDVGRSVEGPFVE